MTMEFVSLIQAFHGLARRLFDFIFSLLKLAGFLYQDNLFCKDLFTPKLSFETRIHFLNVTPIRHSVILIFRYLTFFFFLVRLCWSPLNNN